MLIKAKQKYIRTSPRKLRLVVDHIRDMEIESALTQLDFIRKRAAQNVKKVIRQAVSNAVNNHNIDLKNLKFNRLVVEEGPTFKRWRAVSRGRAHPIMKRTSHLSVVLESRDLENKSISVKTKKRSQPTKVKSIKKKEK